MTQEESAHSHPDPSEVGLPIGISDAQLFGESASAAKLVLGGHESFAPEDTRLLDTLDTVLSDGLDVDTENLSPGFAERLDGLERDDLKKLLISFGRRAVEAETRFETVSADHDKTKAQLLQAKISHGQQITAIRDRNERTLDEVKKTAQKRHEELQEKATHDPLTGLLNRAGFLERLAGIQTYGGRQKSSVLFVDLDHFKDINDEHGHAVGDKVLKRVAEVLQTGRRDTDVVARLGGDEFVVLLTGIEIRDAEQIALELSSDIQGDYVSKEGKVDLNTSASIGLSPLDQTLDPNEALLSADDAMYRAKRAGTGQVVRVDFAHPDHIEPLH